MLAQQKKTEQHSFIANWNKSLKMDLKELPEDGMKSLGGHHHSGKPQLMSDDSSAWDYEDILQKIGK